MRGENNGVLRIVFGGGKCFAGQGREMGSRSLSPRTLFFFLFSLIGEKKETTPEILAAKSGLQRGPKKGIHSLFCTREYSRTSAAYSPRFDENRVMKPRPTRASGCGERGGREKEGADSRCFGGWILMSAGLFLVAWLLPQEPKG